MPTVNSKTLTAISAVSTLTAIGLALYIAFSGHDSEQIPQSPTAKSATSSISSSEDSTELKREAKKEAKKNRHPLVSNDPAYEGCIYLDYNATTPVYIEVFESMVPYFTHYFGNPSSSHLFGPTPKRAIELARLQVAKLISCTAPYDEIIFTGCGTESDNRAIDIAIHQYLQQRGLSIRTCPNEQLPEVLTTRMEHPAVLCHLRVLKLQGLLKLVILPVTNEGFVLLPELEKALTKNTALVSIMHSNNEVGTLQPIRAISHIISNFNKREKTKILFHSDAAQSVGKVPIDVQFLGVDMLTIVGHKYGAPKGIGILYARRSTVTEIPQLLVGGGQEKGRRGGTENVPYIVGLGTASAYASSHLLENILNLLSLKLYFLSSLQTTLQAQGWTHLVKFNGPKRSVHYQQLQDDMKVLRLLFQSNQGQSSPVPPTQNTSTSSTAASSAANTPKPPAETASNNGNNSPSRLHHTHNHQRVYVPENTAADVLEQLPNTISVSFKGLIGHEIVSELGNKVFARIDSNNLKKFNLFCFLFISVVI